jgi:hypothetical protein
MSCWAQDHVGGVARRRTADRRRVALTRPSGPTCSARPARHRSAPPPRTLEARASRGATPQPGDQLAPTPGRSRCASRPEALVPRATVVRESVRRRAPGSPRPGRRRHQESDRARLGGRTSPSPSSRRRRRKRRSRAGHQLLAGHVLVGAEAPAGRPKGPLADSCCLTGTSYSCRRRCASETCPSAASFFCHEPRPCGAVVGASASVGAFRERTTRARPGGDRALSEGVHQHRRVGGRAPHCA